MTKIIRVWYRRNEEQDSYKKDFIDFELFPFQEDVIKLEIGVIIPKNTKIEKTFNVEKEDFQ